MKITCRNKEVNKEVISRNIFSVRVNFRNFHTVESTGSSSREETNITSLMLEKQIKHKRRFLRENLFDEKNFANYLHNKYATS